MTVRLKVSKLFLLLACMAFLVGLFVPVAIVLDKPPSVMVYGLVFFSFPVWTLGAICSGVAAWRHVACESRLSRFFWFASLLAALNVAAVLACLIWSPEGVS